MQSLVPPSAQRSLEPSAMLNTEENDKENKQDLMNQKLGERGIDFIDALEEKGIDDDAVFKFTESELIAMMDEFLNAQEITVPQSMGQ
jgi:hypothetical protein